MPPNNTDTLIYCDETLSEGLLLFEISKDILYPSILKILHKHSPKNLIFDDQRMFNTHFKLLNETVLKLPIGSFINRNAFIRYIFIES